MDVMELHDEIQSSARPLIQEMNELREKLQTKYDKMLFYKVGGYGISLSGHEWFFQGIEDCMALSRHTNAFFQVHAPWKLKQGPKVTYSFSLRSCITNLFHRGSHS